METLRFLLGQFSHQTAEEPWLRLVDVEEREKQYGNTAFHICAYAGHVELLEELVKHAQTYQVPVEFLKSSRGQSHRQQGLLQSFGAFHQRPTIGGRRECPVASAECACGGRTRRIQRPSSAGFHQSA